MATHLSAQAAEPMTTTDSAGMKMVHIKAGSFQMRSEPGDFDEKPVHKVTISRPFHLGAAEGTNARFEQFEPEPKTLRGKLGFSKDDDEAVVLFSWQEAVAFCRWLSEKEGKPPPEAGP